MGPQNTGRCRQEVAIQRWSFAQVYCTLNIRCRKTGHCETIITTFFRYKIISCRIFGTGVRNIRSLWHPFSQSSLLWLVKTCGTLLQIRHAVSADKAKEILLPTLQFVRLRGRILSSTLFSSKHFVG